LWQLTFFLLQQQWFPTISLKRGKSRPTILLESPQKVFNTSKLTRFFTALTKSLTQNFRGITERLLRVA